MNNPQIGDRVQVGHGAGVRQGVLRSVGRCDFCNCKNGIDCAEVVIDGRLGRQNFRYDDLVVATGPLGPIG